MAAGESELGEIKPASVWQFKAHDKLEEGDEKEAFRLFRKAVAEGDESAQHGLAYCYDVGIGTRKNFSKALYWYKKSWRSSGYRATHSCSNIAILYKERGRRDLAIYWMKLGIDGGDGEAALELAKLYLERSNRNRALAVLQKAVHMTRFTEDGREETLALLKSLSDP